MAEERFNVRDAVRFFGGPASLARRATLHGNPLTVKAIEKWQQRDRIPGDWLVRMTSIAKIEKRHFEIRDFIHTAKQRQHA